MYDYVFFDLDGTLTDSGDGIVNSVEYGLNKMGIEVADRSVLYKFVGPPLKESLAKYYGIGDDRNEEAIRYYREYFTSKGMFENSVYEGVSDMLRELKEGGKKLVLATAKPEVFAIKIMEHFNLAGYFDLMAGASLDSTRSQKSQVIKYALDILNLEDKTKAVMVGDRDNDILGACDNGLDSIGVLYGYGDREELKSAGADYIVSTPKEVTGVILSNK